MTGFFRWPRAGRTAQRATGRRLRIESLEPRLALTWAGVPPAAVAPPTSALGITLNSQGDATGTAGIASTEVDYYAFTATATGAYTFTTATPSSGLDTVIGLFSASGQRLGYNDDIVYATNTDSNLTLNLTAGARYYLGITNYTSSSRGAYNWSINGPAGPTISALRDDAYENNDTLSTASNLGTLTASRTVRQLVMADSADWFRFTTTATGTTSNSVTINFQNSQGNLDLAIYNSSGIALRSAAGNTNSESISLRGLGAGTYYARVYGRSGATNPSYSLVISAPISTTTPTIPTTPTQPSTGNFQITLDMTGLTTSQQNIFRQAAQRWQQIITGDLPNATYRGIAVDDVLISASAAVIDGVGSVLGQAGPDAFRSGSRLPIHGTMEFDSADLANMERTGQLLSVVIHEMGHVLGIGTLWNSLGLISGAGTSNPIFTGAQATARYNQLTGSTGRGVPVEAGGGSGTALAHWRESTFRNEIMTGWINSGANPLSVITIASLADLGYQVNFAAADAFTLSAAGATASSTASSSRSSLRSSLTTEEETLQALEDFASRVSTRPLRPEPARQREFVSTSASRSRAIDLALADASERFSMSSSSPLFCSDADDATEDAWDELAQAWQGLQPALALL